MISKITINIADEGQFLDPTIVIKSFDNVTKLIKWLEKSTGLEFTETSRFRMNNDGVHGALPVRGIDLRCRSLEIGITIEAYINKFWTYDPKRTGKKCCYLHGKGSSLHFHL